MKSNSIVLVAGHSGGHTIPGMLIAAVYQKKYNASLYFFSTTKELDAAIAHDYQCTYIPFTMPTGNRLWNKLRRAWSVGVAFLKSMNMLSKQKPLLVISTGGLVSIPVCVAAYFLKIPIVLIELNVIPGKAVALLARFATTVLVVFKQAQEYLPTAAQCEYPLRFTVEQKLITQNIAQELLQLPKKQFTLLVVGGSQGSFFINTLVQQFFIKYSTLCSRISVIHQSGHAYQQNLNDWYAMHKINARVFAFNNQMHTLYQAADLIVCRAGSGTLHEIAFFSKKACVIPLVTATTDHQVANASAIQERYPALFTLFNQADLHHNPEQIFNFVVQEYEKYAMNQKNEQAPPLSHQQLSL